MSVSLLLQSCAEIPLESLHVPDTISSLNSGMPASEPFVAEETVKQASNCELDILSAFFLLQRCLPYTQ